MGCVHVRVGVGVKALRFGVISIATRVDRPVSHTQILNLPPRGDLATLATRAYSPPKSFRADKG